MNKNTFQFFFKQKPMSNKAAAVIGDTKPRWDPRTTRRSAERSLREP